MIFESAIAFIEIDSIGVLPICGQYQLKRNLRERERERERPEGGREDVGRDGGGRRGREARGGGGRGEGREWEERKLWKFTVNYYTLEALNFCGGIDEECRDLPLETMLLADIHSRSRRTQNHTVALRICYLCRTDHVAPQPHTG